MLIATVPAPEVADTAAGGGLFWLIVFLVFPLVVTLGLVAIVALTRLRQGKADPTAPPTPEQVTPPDAEGRGKGPVVTVDGEEVT